MTWNLTARGHNGTEALEDLEHRVDHCDHISVQAGACVVHAARELVRAFPHNLVRELITIGRSNSDGYGSFATLTVSTANPPHVTSGGPVAAPAPRSEAATPPPPAPALVDAVAPSPPADCYPSDSLSSTTCDAGTY